MYRILFFLAIIGAVYVIYDVWTDNKRLNETQKLVWTLAAIFASLITVVIYYFSFKRNK